MENGEFRIKTLTAPKNLDKSRHSEQAVLSTISAEESRHGILNFCLLPFASRHQKKFLNKTHVN